MIQRDDSRETASHEWSETGPGPRLKDARLRLDKDAAEVAEALHLNRRTIEALEADDYTNLPPRTFVRGYIRAYCQFLDMDPEPLIERLSAVGEVDAGQPLRPRAGEASSVTRSGRPARQGTGFMGVALSLALLIAVLVAGGWWLSRSDLSIPMLQDLLREETPEAPAPSTPESAPTTEAENGSAPAAGSGPESDTASDSEAVAEPGAAPVAAPEPDTDPAPEAGTGPDAASAPESGADTDPAPEVAAGADAGGATASGAPEPPAGEPRALDPEALADAVISDGESAADDEPPASSEPPATDATRVDRDVMVLRLSGESWMEITDARGERLLFGIAEAGERRLEGQAPFDVVIGDTTNVVLEFNGQRIDLADYARGNVARFTLEEERG
jgi:cytoskeleton protein RodZ